MDSADFKRDNHFVPRSYLKRWAANDGRLWAYRVLVSHPRVRLWKPTSTRGAAYHEHLYTQISASGESDELERWFDVEFEAPAEDAIEKAVSNRRLTSADWRRLARFFAAQDVRTPARLAENLERWSASLPTMIQGTLDESIAHLESMPEVERSNRLAAAQKNEAAPFRVTVEKMIEGNGGLVKAEAVAGRNLWIWSIRHVLTNTIRVLEQHRWTILTPPDGVTWFTSDDPVVKINFNSLQNYSFGGGWGHDGTDLFLPLGPSHLLYTQVGRRVPSRGTKMDFDKACLVRRFLAEHAHRYVFATAPDPFVATIRPRTISAAKLASESNLWKQWHAEQSRVDSELMGWTGNEPSKNSHK